MRHLQIKSATIKPLTLTDYRYGDTIVLQVTPIRRKSMPFNLGWPEIVIVLVIVLIIFGAGKLPQIGGAIGKSIKEFRRAREDNDDKDKDKTIATSNETEPKEKK
jgi:sec-independent protein translocase protein TatA